MSIISVNASQNYNVIVGSNILAHIGEYVSDVHSNCKVAIISDTNVFPIYGDLVECSLQSSGFETSHFVFPAGEEQKNIHTYAEILDFLSNNQITRSDILIALGGGVVGDISGFAAATYLRGIPYIQIPTSLLAMVDSSVGGKTAIDLPAGKNLAGAFKQPSLVLCDVDVLATLPKQEFVDGCAEVIKYSILYDAELFQYLLNAGVDFDREAVITKCISYKANIVHEDEFDTGLRQKLNFGHTFGHGIEKLSNFTLSHGQAVAIGMAIVSKAAVENQICDANVLTSLTAILQRFSLPAQTNYSAKELYLAMLSDKKRSGSCLNLIVPKSIGNCSIIKIVLSDLESFIEAGL